MEARKRRQRRRSEDASCTSGGESRSGRDWRKSKVSLCYSNISETSRSSSKNVIRKKSLLISASRKLDSRESILNNNY